jgi:hypothetical protein
MNNIFKFLCFCMIIFNGFGQESITISPNNTSTLKFHNSNNQKEKLTIYDEGINSKMGIGVNNNNMYIHSTPIGSMFLGQNNLNSRLNSLEINMDYDMVGIKTGVSVGYNLMVNGSARLRNSGNVNELSGIWFDKADVIIAEKNTFIGYDTLNNFTLANTGSSSFGFYKAIDIYSAPIELLRIKENGNLEISGSIKNEVNQFPVYSSPWANFGNGYMNGNYYKDKENVVHLSGGIKALNPENNILIFTLPVGYWPENSLTFKVDAYFGTKATILIQPDGYVFYKSFTNNANDEYKYVSLSGISFRVN